MTHRQREKYVFIHKPFGITATPDLLHVDLKGETREAVGLGSVRKALASDRGFCQITCFRADLTFSANVRGFEQMPRKLNELLGRKGIGGYWLIGHWIEAVTDLSRARPDDNHAEVGNAKHSLEYSWLFRQPANLSDDDWLLAMRLIAEERCQSAFILRPNGSQAASLYDAEGPSLKTMSSADEIIAAFKTLTFLRSRESVWKRGDFDQLSTDAAEDVADAGRSGFVVHPSTAAPTAVGPSAITFYAAVPHCISASLFFSILNVHRGG